MRLGVGPIEIAVERGGHADAGEQARRDIRALRAEQLERETDAWGDGFAEGIATVLDELENKSRTADYGYRGAFPQDLRHWCEGVRRRMADLIPAGDARA